MQALWDWGIFDECFTPTRIRISDVDGVVERNGNVLFIEAKSAAAGVTTGQSILFTKLAESGFHVLVLFGAPGVPEFYMWFSPRKPKGGAKHICTLHDVQALVRRWFDWANGQQ